MYTNLFETIKTRFDTAYDPLSIYIFASYTWGIPTKDSDIDLVVVVNSSDKKLYKRAVEGFRALRGLGITKDILVYTKDEFKFLSDDVSSLLYKLKHKGVKLL